MCEHSVQKYFPEQDMGDKQGMKRLMTELSCNVIDGDDRHGGKRSRKFAEDDEKNPWDT